MGWFSRKKEKTPEFPAEQYEPVLRCSICTGEQVACMREREGGRLREIMLIRDEEDLERFRKTYGVTGEIRKIY